MRSIDLAALSEIWQVDAEVNTEKMLELPELNGIDLIYSARPKGKKGGGVGIATNKETFETTRLDVQVPKYLEVLWAFSVPKNPSINKFLICSFYSPPKQGRNQAMVDHLSDTY